ncbi:hypothetical protein NEISUBOT_05369 [Neisseria subflava NJ9703]|uniref:Uncharacterized protein n=1 Tax=Neisseria subflava NJ9703 TaxID=546268 RepID=A0A9W5INZ2_NEISU|nr:hypothetical protein NEISUBOT_05369 [Neisseria subflava NJ9703]
MELKKANHGLRISGTDDEDLLMSQMSAWGNPIGRTDCNDV